MTVLLTDFILTSYLKYVDDGAFIQTLFWIYFVIQFKNIQSNKTRMEKGSNKGSKTDEYFH